MTSEYSIEALEEAEIKRYRDYWDQLVHPTGSLGELEEIGIRASAILGEVPEKLEKKAMVVFCNDNGILEENVSSSPRILTKLLAETMASKCTGVNSLARTAGADVIVVDLGIEDFEDFPGVLNRRISNGTKNFMIEDAMSLEEVEKAIQVGYDIATDLIQKGYKVLGAGELGMGNTTTSAAVISLLLDRDADEVVGLGSGVDDQQFKNKVNVVKSAEKIRRVDKNDPIDVLRKVGGYDIAAMVGLYLACAENRIIGVVDGIIGAAAALVTNRINKNSTDYLFGSHIAKEKGARFALEDIGLRAYLDMSMRLGEGSGCPLFFLLLDSSIDCMNQMTKFEETDIINTLVNIRDK